MTTLAKRHQHKHGIQHGFLNFLKLLLFFKNTPFKMIIYLTDSNNNSNYNNKNYDDNDEHAILFVEIETTVVTN